MIQKSGFCEKQAVLTAAYAMCAAARTAPKTKGQDYLDTCVVSEDADLECLAAEMERLGEKLGYEFFLRDAGNIRASQAVVLIGTRYVWRGLNEGCGYCNQVNCKACQENHSVCVYDPIDLGIAIGSAVSVAADHRIDNRVMFSAGKAALSLGWMGEEIRMIYAIPLSASGKSLYFDRKPRK